MLEAKILIALVGSGLFFWGGYSWHNARRFILPTILALSLAWITHSWWALTSLSVIGIFCLGYGEKSPLRHCFGDGWGRGIWGLLSAIAISLSLLLAGHICWWLWLPYLAINFTLENALKNIPQVIGDPIIGLGLCSIVFIIK